MDNNNSLAVKSLCFKNDLELFSRRKLEKANEMVDEIGKYFFNKDKEYLVLVCLSPRALPVSVNITDFKSFENLDTFARDALRTIILSGPGAFTVLHNRVGDNASNLKVSAIDEQITDYFVQLARASQSIILDHILVGNNNGTPVYFSYREKKKKKLSSIGKTFQEMMGDFRVDNKLFPDASSVASGWEKKTVFTTIYNKEEMDAFFAGEVHNV